MLEFPCPTCGKRVQGDDSLAGKHVVCPGCNATVPMPGATASTAITDGEPAMAKWPRHPDTPLDEPVAPSVRKPGIFIPTTIGFLVIGTMLVILVALMAPKISDVADRSSVTLSVNHLKQIGLAMQAYHDTNNRMPFNGNVLAKADDRTTGSWAFQLLPYIGENTLFIQPNTITAVQPYMCPGRGRPSLCTTGAWTDYMINPWINDPANGAADARDAKRGLKNIQDGTSNTIFAGHGTIDIALYARNEPHVQSTDIFKGGDRALARNRTKLHRDEDGNRDEDVRPPRNWGGPFPQGALMVFCDGTVRMIPFSTAEGFIRNGVAEPGFGTFLTPSGNEAFPLPD